MKKIFSILFVVVFAFSFANAQSKMSLGVGGNLALPMGSFGDVSSMGFGGGAKFEYAFSDNIVSTVSVQYLMFGAKDDRTGVSWSIIPVIVGAKYYFGSSFYTMAESGMNFWTSKVKIPEVRIGGMVIIPEQEESISDSDFGFAFGAGYELALGNNALDLSVKYQNYAKETNAINFGVAYKFSF